MDHKLQFSPVIQGIGITTLKKLSEIWKDLEEQRSKLENLLGYEPQLEQLYLVCFNGRINLVN